MTMSNIPTPSIKLQIINNDNISKWYSHSLTNKSIVTPDNNEKKRNKPDIVQGSQGTK